MFRYLKVQDMNIIHEVQEVVSQIQSMSQKMSSPEHYLPVFWDAYYQIPLGYIHPQFNTSFYIAIRHEIS